MREVLARIVDAGSWTEYKAGYGQTLLCGYARVDGWSVGVVASQRAVVKAHSPQGRAPEMQIGGVIYSDSADKAARFIMNCNQKRMVGTRAEQGGIIKDGAKLVNAVANSVVPKLTFILGNSFGAGNYALCGKAYDPRLIFAWPTAQIAVMGGSQAAKTLLQIQTAKLKKQGMALSDDDQQALLKEIEARYQEQMSPYYAAARLWVDEIIEPAATRQWISTGIALADHNPEIPRFNPGVLQT
jgi:acetyl-CoA carboxylase carboxyltransferase component